MIFSGFSEAEEYRLLKTPIDCHKYKDKCQIDYDSFCTRRINCLQDKDMCEIQDQYCHDKVATEYNTYCSRPVNCEEEPEKCLISDQYCPDIVQANYNDYCDRPIDCKERPDQCLIQEQYCFDKVAAKYDAFCPKAVNCTLQPEKCLDYFSQDKCVHNRCVDNQVFDSETNQCVSCGVYQLASNNTCFNVCSWDQVYDFEEHKCVYRCPYNQMLVDGVCEYRCQDGKAFNRHHETNNLSRCLTFYEILHDVGTTNQILMKAAELNSLGGPLTEPLKCDSDTNIETVYSAKLIKEEDMYNMHFIEIISNDY